MDFINYTDVLLSAFKKHGKKNEIIAKKREILESVYELNNYTPLSCICVGFSPFILATGLKKISYIEMSDQAVNFLYEQGIEATKFDGTGLPSKKIFDLLLVTDEFFTFANSEEEQKEKIKLVSKLANGIVLTTLRDYKNQDFKDKEFSFPASVRDQNDITVYLEHHIPDFKDRSQWKTSIFELGDQLVKHGPYERRAMFFKQLAKFSKDFGASDFLIHKDVMYKSLLKKNYEHVISIRFEPDE